VTRKVRESLAAGGWQGFLREMTGNGRAPEVRPLVKAAMSAELGEKDNALEALNRMYEERRAGLLGIKVDPRFDSLRSAFSRFAAACRAVVIV